MFNPSRDDVRRFFCAVWRKHREGSVLTPIEATAQRWIAVHPEYHAMLDDEARALAEEFTVERGESNPFLHLSMHLALDEQLSIDQPPGIVAAFRRLAERAGNAHDAAHEAMECLGEIVWQAQRGAGGADMEAIGAAYLDCLRRRAGR
jgi:hypothetical protein